MDRVSHVTLRGFTFEAARGTAIAGPDWTTYESRRVPSAI